MAVGTDVNVAGGETKVPIACAATTGAVVFATGVEVTTGVKVTTGYDVPCNIFRKSPNAVAARFIGVHPANRMVAPAVYINKRLVDLRCLIVT
jgi:hypothetical protein